MALNGTPAVRMGRAKLGLYAGATRVKYPEYARGLIGSRVATRSACGAKLTANGMQEKMG